MNVPEPNRQPKNGRSEEPKNNRRTAIPDQVGPLFRVLELQARWIAYSWSGLVQPITREAMREAIRQFQPDREMRTKTFMHQMAIAFSREIGAEPDLSAHPELTRAAVFCPLAAVSSGPDPLPQAAERFVEEARRFGAVSTAELNPQQKAQLHALSQAKGAATAG